MMPDPMIPDPMATVLVERGDSPLVLGLPHTGTQIPEDVAARLNETGLAMADTDWHIHTLYADLVPDVTTVRTTLSRYVIDVNRDPAGRSLYPGQNTTSLCPTTDFDGRPIYRQGEEPEAGEIAERIAAFHQPYHRAMAEELNRVKARHGFAILYDAHSIRSRIAHLFDGVLPDFNIGTNAGTTCDRSIETAVHGICKSAAGYTTTLNGRFKGGWTTRHYGKPDQGMHAIQMELAQSTYMQEHPPWPYRNGLADALRVHLRTVLNTLLLWRPS